MLFLIGTWIYVVFRSIPLRDGDRGVFASMAERIAAGDTLYVDVWDNKEPLFFLTLGAGRMLSPAMDVAIELVWIVLASLAIFQVMIALNSSRFMAALVGFGGTPIIVMGGVYAAGFSHLPSTAILLGIIALSLHRKWFFAGALIVILAGFKIIVVPIAVLSILPLIINPRWRKTLVTLVLGGGITGVLLAGILALRGEFIGFINLVRSNIGYSQSSISDAYDLPILKHIEPVFTQATVITFTATLVAILLVYVLAPQVNKTYRRVVILSLAGAFLVTAITGLWNHHGQIFYGPAALALALLFGTVTKLNKPRIANIFLVFAISLVLAAIPSLRSVIDTVLSGPTRFNGLSRVSQPSQDLLAIADSGTYQRLGMNTDDSHAYGLGDFTLNCYQFVQYTYDLRATLEFIPECLPATDYLLVDKEFVIRDNAPEWNDFVVKSETAIKADFTCSEKPWGRLCINKSLSE